MLDSVKPGQNIRLTLTSVPFRLQDKKTVARLMRFDPSLKRGLAKGQRRRVKDLIVRGRGGRPWEVRERSAKVVRVEAGATWTMKYFPQIAPDLGAVAGFLKVSPA